MYKDYYQLTADPFRLMPVAGMAYPHRSYREALAGMERELQQGEGILVISGRSGTGKSTLIEDFIAGLRPGQVSTAVLSSTNLEADDLLRMVGYKFAVNGEGLDKATLLRALEERLTPQRKTLLIIDEAQNLSAAALEEVRMLSSMHVGARPLLQIFLLGQESLHKKIHCPGLEQLHQRLTSVYHLQQLNLQETCDFVIHRLESSGWRGVPTIDTDAIVAIYRFSQGIPRYISKLCARLFLHGVVEKLQRLALDDVIEVIGEVRDELLLPLPDEAHSGLAEVLSDIQRSDEFKALPIERRLALTAEEQEFIANQPAVKWQSQKTSMEVPVATVERYVARSQPKQSVTAEKSAGNVNTRPLTACRVPPLLHQAFSAIRGMPWERLVVSSGVAALLVLAVVQLQRSSDPFPQDVTATAAEDVFAEKLPPKEPFASVLTLISSDKPAVAEKYPKTESGDTYRQRDHTQETDVLEIIQPAVKSIAVVDSSSLSPLPAIEPPAMETSLATDFATVPSTPTVRVRAKSRAMPVATAAKTANAEPATTDSAEAASPRTAEETTMSEPQQDTAVQMAAQSPDLAQVGTLAEQTSAPAANDPIERFLLLAEQAIQRDRLRTPHNSSAWFYYNQVLELEPDNSAARRGLQRIVARYKVLADVTISRQQFDKAETFIARGLKISSGDEELLALRQKIETRRAELLALQSGSTTEHGPDAGRHERKGLFGALRRFFAGESTTGSSD